MFVGLAILTVILLIALLSSESASGQISLSFAYSVTVTLMVVFRILVG